MEVFTHAPAQREKPASQAVPQALLVQVAVPFATVGHVVPHVPQLSTSLFVSTQLPLQAMNGRLHWKAQLPVHTGMAFVGAVHTVPHLPQFEVSVAVSTQEPLQLVWVPQLLVQTPALHTVPAPQRVAQSPQCAEFDWVSTQAPLQSV